MNRSGCSGRWRKPRSRPSFRRRCGRHAASRRTTSCGCCARRSCSALDTAGTTAADAAETVVDGEAYGGDGSAAGSTADVAAKGEPAQRSEPEAAPVTENSGRGLYAYATTRSGDLDLSRVAAIADDRAPQVIERGDLALVVSEIALSELEDVSTAELTEDSRLASLARQHDAVVRATFEQEPVLPLRFGTVLTGRSAALHLLESRDREARELLAMVDGHCEWGVRVNVAPGAAEPAETHNGRERGPTPSGTAYLSRRREVLKERDASQRRRQAVLDETHRTLAARARDSAVRTTSSQDALFEAAYLLPRTREEEFFAEADRLAERLTSQGMALETTGPWPPYSFARASGEVADD
ncbi:MAG: hypothetical protein GEU98_22350 [Pseudonocardiaceae bacterium]|nr:hypothetical protein [Pseudonocardiaceae bacterium]